MMMKSNELLAKLDIMIKDPKCELEYNKDYELLIATVLSAQCTDKRVNMVTKELFKKYDIFKLANADIKDIENIIMPVGTFRKKSEYIIEISKKLVKDYNGVVPNNRKYLESLPGVGRKTCNVVLSNIYNEPAIAVDTHVQRVSKRLSLAKEQDDVYKIEKKLMKYFPKDKWSRTHHQLVLFGRYICKSKNPNCQECLLKENCKYYKKIKSCD
jgi:endonuclease-3